VTVTILAVDLKRKKVVKRIDRRADVVGPDGAYRFPFTTQLPPGSYQLRASVASAASGKSGSVYLAIDVPAPPKLGIAIAGASLSLRGNGDGVVLDRVFVPSDALQVSYWIARADPAAVVSTTIEVLDSNGVVGLASTPELPADQSAPVRADVSLKSLPAGSYRLRMIARSSAGEAAREIGFAIKTQ
jgi:hypothetical protein